MAGACGRGRVRAPPALIGRAAGSHQPTRRSGGSSHRLAPRFDSGGVHFDSMVTVSWLVGTSEQPPRPDWPILRHLTYDEVHAAELGLPAGLAVGALYCAGRPEQAAAVGVGLLVYALGLRQLARRFIPTPDEPRRGLRVITREPWYFLAPALVGVALALRYCGAVA